MNAARLSSESRGRLWWQLAQLSCPRNGSSDRESESHIPFVKAQLAILHRVARATVDSYRAAASEEDIKLYHRYVRKIFSNNRVSLTALNIKSLQCAYLFSLMTKHIPNPEKRRYGAYIEDSLWTYLSEVRWTSYDAVLQRCIDHEPDEEEYDLKWLLIEDEFGGDETWCIPSLKNKAIIVLLGELSLYELVWSLAQDVYFIGLIPGLGYADGAMMHPVSFLTHDLDHMHDRLLLCQEEKGGRGAEINARTLHFLGFLAARDAAVQQTCLMFLFLYMHHEIECKEAILLQDVIAADSGPFRPGGEEDELIYLPDRFLRQNDFHGFLPAALKEGATAETVIEWLRGEWLIFTETWNTCFAAGPVAAAPRRRTSSDRRSRYRAATLRNANALARRRRTRRTSVKK
jgi:hypothetical protein